MAKISVALIMTYMLICRALIHAADHSAEDQGMPIVNAAEAKTKLSSRHLTGEISTAEPSPSPSTVPTLGSKQTRHLPLQFSILLPLLSASAIMWALHRHKQICCSGDSAADDSIPSEIVLGEKEGKKKSSPKPDIELQCVVGNHRSRTSMKYDPVMEASLLNQSDWTDENSQKKDSSFSWMEESSAANYEYMND